MGNYLTENVIIDIVIDKLIYDPGEIINGYLEIKPKTYLNESIFGNESTTIKLTENYGHSYYDEDGKSYKDKESSDLYEQTLDSKYFEGANILLGVKIPFSIQIPLDIQPTVNAHNYYIFHYVTIKTPLIKFNKSKNIIIKEHRFFTFENKLLKIPKIHYKEFFKCIDGSGGRISCFFKLQKNSFIYNEKIPFELHLDCTEYNPKVKEVIITINKNLFLNYKEENDKKVHFKTDFEKKMFYTNFNIENSKQQKHELKGTINILKNDNCKEAYLSMERMKDDKLIRNVILAPFCMGKYVSIEYTLKVEIKYKERFRDTFEFPVEIISYDDNYNLNPIPQSNVNNKEKIEEKPNDINKYDDINSIENNDIKKYDDINNIEDNDIKKYDDINSIEDNNIKKDDDSDKEDDFIVYEKDDFEKIYFGEKKK